MNTQSYADLEIRILERQDAGYPVEITLNGDQYFLRGFLAADVLPWISSGNAQADGERLFTALLGDSPAREAWARTCGQYPQRRVRLRLDTTAPELHALPWELLHDGQTFLAAHTSTPLSRYLPLDTPSGALVSERPIRVLAALSNPTDLVAHNLAPLDVPTEHTRLEALWRTLSITPVFLEPPVTPERLEVALREHRPHILHLIAHGAFSQRRSQAVLYLQDDAGNTCFIQDVDFANIFDRLGQEDRPRLIFLTACESAMRSTVDAFAGLAPKLVQAGVPAVVAMQDKVTIAAAHKLTATFYTGLFRHGEVDRALNAARSLLLTGQSPNAGVPVLLMRLKDGKLWETIQPAAPTRRDFYTHAPRLEPERYINRPHEYAQIKTLLLAGPATKGLTTALCGAGGYGKTTLARVLCDDADIQARFADGILWATLGENPDVLTRLREWVTALGGIISENAPTIPQLVNRLTDLLRDGAYLLLIDDVWDGTVLVPFLCGGPRCGHLVTTRNRATLPAGVQSVDVDAMRTAEAVALLGYGLDGREDTPEAAALQALVQRLGNWPLLLGIINGVLRDCCAQGTSLSDALAYVAEGLAEEGLTAFDVADATDRARAVRATLDVSLKRLSSADRACYTELAIFPEDTDIPATAAAQLWGQIGGLSAFKTKDLFRRLGNASLVQTYDAEHQTMRLHDVVHVYLADALGPEGCAAAHRALLDAYRETVTLSVAEGSPTPWHTAPDDSYLYAHLAYHLDALAVTDTNAAAELAALFATDDWLQVRVAVADYTYDGYLADLEYAWRRAEENTHRQIAECAPPDALAECVRCALTRTTVNSLAGRYEPELVARAVEAGAWSPERALSVTASMPGPQQRARTYTMLLKLGVFTEAQREVALRGGLAAARAIGNTHNTLGNGVDALVALAPQLTGAVLAEELAMARAIRGNWDRMRVLAALAPQLTGVVREQMLAEELAAARVIKYEESRAKVLAALAPQLTGAAREQARAEGLAAARVIKHEMSRAKALAALAPQLTGAVLAEGLAVARAIKDEHSRAQALATLTPQLTGAAQEQALAEGLAAARAIKYEHSRAQALAALAPQLTGAVLAEGLAVARAIKYKDYRAQALAALVPQLTGAVLAEGLAEARAIKDEHSRAQALAALAPQLTGAVLAEGLAEARAIKDEHSRAQALAALAPQLTGAVLAEGLAVARAIKDEHSRAQVLAALVPQLTGAAQEQALAEGLAAARAIKYEHSRAQALAALAPQLTGAAREQALAEGLAAARAIKYEHSRAQALAALVPQLTGAAREQALAEGLAAARAIWDARDRAEAFAALAPQLTEELLVKGLVMVPAIEDEKYQTEALVAWTQPLPGAAQLRVIRDVITLTAGLLLALQYFLYSRFASIVHKRTLVKELAEALAIEDEISRAQALKELAPQLTGAAREQALAEGLAAARAIKDEWHRVQALEALTPQLKRAAREQALAEGLAAARAIKNERHRAEALEALAQQLKRAAREQALAEGLAATLAIENAEYRAKALKALAPQLKGAAREQALAEGLAAARAIRNEWNRAEALAALLPRFTGAAAQSVRKDYQAAILAALRAVENEEREEVLELLADKDVFRPDALDLTPAAVARIAEAVVDVCQRWEWV